MSETSDECSFSEKLSVKDNNNHSSVLDITENGDVPSNIELNHKSSHSLTPMVSRHHNINELKHVSVHSTNKQNGNNNEESITNLKNSQNLIKEEANTINISTDTNEIAESPGNNNESDESELHSQSERQDDSQPSHSLPMVFQHHQTPLQPMTNHGATNGISQSPSNLNDIIQLLQMDRRNYLQHQHQLTLISSNDEQAALDGPPINITRYHQPPKSIDRDSARRLARRLYESDGFKITDVAKHLAKRNDFSQVVAEEFANFFDFTGQSLDESLRQFLGRFTLTGETSERERIMFHFSRRYVTCNPQVYKSDESCHTLVCALIILNTNIHSNAGPNNSGAMTCAEFLQNLQQMNDGDDYSDTNINELYESIAAQSIRWPVDDSGAGGLGDQLVNIDPGDVARCFIAPGGGPHSQMISAATVAMDNPLLSGGAVGGSAPLLDLTANPQEGSSREFMQGYLVRKWLRNSRGVKTSFLRRSWRVFYSRLRDLTILLYKDHSSGTPANQNDSQIRRPSNQIRIDHAIATRATDYTKKPFVWRLVTDKAGEYLFEVNSQSELSAWIDNVNMAAALLSEPISIHSGDTTVSRKHSGSSTPNSDNASSLAAAPRITSLNIKDQLESHQRCVLELESVISQLKEPPSATNHHPASGNPPTDGNAAGSARSNNNLHTSDSSVTSAIKYRSDQLHRYKLYSQILETELMKMTAATATTNQQRYLQMIGAANSLASTNQMVAANHFALWNIQQHQQIHSNNISAAPTTTTNHIKYYPGGGGGGSNVSHHHQLLQLHSRSLVSNTQDDSFTPTISSTSTSTTTSTTGNHPSTTLPTQSSSSSSSSSLGCSVSQLPTTSPSTTFYEVV